MLYQIRSVDDGASQVGVARVLACPPLSEEEAFPVLAPNYLGGGSNKFRFSLTQQQVREQSSASCGQRQMDRTAWLRCCCELGCNKSGQGQHLIVQEPLTLKPTL
jgi:hypothetical protein